MLTTTMTADHFHALNGHDPEGVSEQAVARINFKMNMSAFVHHLLCSHQLGRPTQSA
jgi:hypothetical protein